jgi:polysaccharide export outer membrane protein
MSLRKLCYQIVNAALLVTFLGIVSGCASKVSINPPVDGQATLGGSNSGDVEALRAGDFLKITFAGPTTVKIDDHEERIPEDGQISLRGIGKLNALGKTRVQLQDEIQKRYVPSVYKQLTVTIAPGERFFYLSGEVKKADRYTYLGGLTVSRAIAIGGDFSEFAKKRAVEITRVDGRVDIADCVKALKEPSKYDLRIYPGDKINVPRKLF